MEAMDIILATFRDVSYVIANHPVYSVLGCFVLSVGMLRFYCRLTVGMCYCDQDMTGKTVLITGATAGKSPTLTYKSCSSVSNKVYFSYFHFFKKCFLNSLIPSAQYFYFLLHK